MERPHRPRQEPDQDGHEAMGDFPEIGSGPSTMAACRLLLAAFCLVKDTMFLQSECIRAYVQAKMTFPPTVIRLPKAW
jgi:hypothetical protein